MWREKMTRVEKGYGRHEAGQLERIEMGTGSLLLVGVTEPCEVRWEGL